MCIYFFPFFFAERRGFLRRSLLTIHILPEASCAIRARIYSLKQTWTRKYGLGLRRDGDSNPGNPFGVYTLSRRASSTTRASLPVAIFRLPSQIGCKLRRISGIASDFSNKCTFFFHHTQISGGQSYKNPQKFTYFKLSHGDFEHF